MADEVWKVIPDWPEYEVSDHGRVRRKISVNGCRAGYVLKPYVRKPYGHMTVNLCRNAKIRVSRVHRLVASAFLAGDTTLQVCHNDGNTANNHVSNLRYDTNKGNSSDTVKHGRSPKGERNGRNKYSQELIKLVKEKLRNGVPPSECARLFGIPVRYIYVVRSGKNWGWLE